MALSEVWNQAHIFNKYMFFTLAILTRNIVPLWVLFVLRSIGIGIIMMSMVAWGMKDIEKDKYSDGTAIICSLRTVAGAFGTALAAMLM